MNRWFPKGKSAFARAEVDWESEDIRVMLVKDGYTFDATDEFLTDVGSTYDNGRTAASIVGKTVSDGGVLDGGDIAVVATDADPSDALIVFVHTGSNATALCLLYIDTAEGLPVSEAGTRTITWSNGSSKIAVL